MCEPSGLHNCLSPRRHLSIVNAAARGNFDYFASLSDICANTFLGGDWHEPLKCKPDNACCVGYSGEYRICRIRGQI
jgi:hypothetical protein